MRDTDGTSVWFRQDLRLGDNPALIAALGSGRPIIPVFIWAPDEEGQWPPGLHPDGEHRISDPGIECHDF